MRWTRWDTPLVTAFLATALALTACVGEAGTVAPSSQPSVHSADDPNSGALPPPGTYELDPPHTFIVWAAKHKIVGAVRGRFDKIAGTLVVAPDPSTCTVDVTIEAPSVSTQNSVRDDDLRSAAFFDAAHFPTITYRGRGIRRSDSDWVMDGSLTIRGITKVTPVRFTFRGVAPAQSGKAARVAFHAQADTRRADFGMTRELHDEIGANATGFDVEIEIDAEALAKTQ